MQPAEQQIRFHSLDALRAWAMLLGIVLHGAWLLLPEYLLIPISDVDSNSLFNYPFSLIHMFRMQVFFLMAGFFAHLVLAKRGRWQFVKHRLSRIGIPLFVGWLTLCPLIVFQYTWGGILSDRILSENGLPHTFIEELVMSSLFNPTNLYHLWFLYDLLLLYAVTLFCLFLADKVFDRQRTLRQRIDDWFRWSLGSRWCIPILCVPSTFFLFFESNWMGVNAIPIWFIPQWAGFCGYCVFFAFGWLLFRHSDLLTVLGRGWKGKLVFGIVLSIPTFAIAQHFGSQVPPVYPILTHFGIGSHSKLVAAATSASNSDSRRPELLVWQALSPPYQKLLLENDELTPDQQFGIAMQLNINVLFNSEFSANDCWKDMDLPDDLADMLADNSHQDGIMSIATLNRRLLETSIPSMFVSSDLDPSRLRSYKIIFSASYAVAMWLLVFGVMGFFLHFCSTPSATSRYIADSAYWVYLVHLPIMFQIELFIAARSWGMFGIPKFVVYALVTTLLCFISYHYLVRSTFIGRVLNGRSYPFVQPFRRT